MANEKRLIYSNRMMEEARKAEFMGFRAEERKQNFLDMISAMLDNCPTVDAVEVVRCKDCKSLEITGCYGECRKLVRIVKPWDFCSYGERREGE